MCKCQICKRNRLVTKNLKKIKDEKVKKFFKELYEEMVNIDFDEEVHNAKLNSAYEFLKEKKLAKEFYEWKSKNKKF
jgi:rubrerythrin